MFCPKCGYKLDDGERFCSGCGADMQSELNTGAPQAQQSAPQAQPVQPVQPVQQYPQPVQPYAQYPQPVQAAPKKKKSKAPLIAVGAGAAAVVLIGGGVAGFMVYQNFAAQKFVQENPTKAVANSYSTFLSERKDPGTAGLFTILSNAQDKGTVKFTYEMNYDYQGYKQDGGLSMIYSYDKNAKQYYLKADSDSLGAFFGVASDNSNDKKLSTLELFTDSKIVNLRYDIEKAQGSFYLDAEHFRESAQNSIFSPSNENVNNMTDEEFEEYISSFEKFYDTVTKDLDQKEDEYVNKLVEIIEKNGNPVVTEEKIQVRGKDRDVYTVTYTFSRESLIAAVKDLKKIAVEAIDENSADIKGLDELKESVEKSFDETAESLSKADSSLQIVLKSSLDKGSKEAAKLELTASNITENVKTLNAFIEFGDDAELDIYAELSIPEENGGKATFTLKSTKDGSKTRYAADVYSKGNKEEQANTAGVALVYDDSAKTYSLTYSVNGDEKTAIEGKADISDNHASFTYEQPMIQYDYSKMNDMDSAMDFIDMSENQIEVGKYAITIDISCDTNIVSFKGDKDFMGLTKDEYEALGESFGQRGSSLPYDYDYDDDYDYDYDDYDDYGDYDYGDIDFNDVNTVSGGNPSDTPYIVAAKGLVGLFNANLAA